MRAARARSSFGTYSSGWWATSSEPGRARCPRRRRHENARGRSRPSVRPAAETSRHARGRWRRSRHERMVERGLRRAGLVRIAAISASTPCSRFARVSMACELVHRGVERSPGSRRRSSTISQFSGMTLSAMPPAMRVTERLAWPTSGWVSRPQFAIAHVEEGHELARGEDRVDPAPGGRNAPPCLWRG